MTRAYCAQNAQRTQKNEKNEVKKRDFDGFADICERKTRFMKEKTNKNENYSVVT